MQKEWPTGIVTLVFTDIVNSSELSRSQGEQYHTSRRVHDKILSDLTNTWQGSVVSSGGDGLFLVFPLASDAVCFAVKAQKALLNEDFSVPLSVRIGINTGEPSLETTPVQSYFGHAVNLTARICGASNGGQILVSSSTKGIAEVSAGNIAGFLTLGEHRLKGVGTVSLFQVIADGLPADFPALRTLEPRKYVLPLPLTTFIGREADIEKWAKLVQHSDRRWICLTGFGGMGKTRTAIRIAEECAGEFEQGIRWVELESTRTEAEAWGKIAESLELVSSAEPAENQVCAYLQERDMLLCLDNTEQIPGFSILAIRLLKSSPLLRILVTSRTQHAPGLEEIIDLPEFDLTDAMHLLAERTRSQNPSFEITIANDCELQEICRLLHGIPLLLELAAARIAGMSPSEFLKRRNRLSQLLSTKSSHLPERQRTIEGAIDWSYELLSFDQQELFAQLAVFDGSFNLEDVEAVCTAGFPLDDLPALRASSMLISKMEEILQEMRYSILLPIEEYACRLLTKRVDHKELEREHAKLYKAKAVEQLALVHGPDEPRAIAALKAMTDNLRCAIRRAKQDNTSLYAELNQLLGESLFRSGVLLEAIAPIEEGLASVPQGSELHALLLRERAGLYLDFQQTEQAADAATKAMEIFSALQDRKGEAQSLNILGLVYIERKEFEQARNHFNDALSLFQKSGHLSGQATVTNNLGLLAQEETNMEAAHALFLSALELYQQRGDLRGQARACNNLGTTAFFREEWTEAGIRYREALELERRLGNRYHIAQLYGNLGELLMESGQEIRAWQLLAVSEYELKSIGAPADNIRFISDLLTRAAGGDALILDRWRTSARQLASVNALIV